MNFGAIAQNVLTQLFDALSWNVWVENKYSPLGPRDSSVIEEHAAKFDGLNLFLRTHSVGEEL